jgi:hypothetical protein
MPLTAIQKKKAKEILLFKVNVLAGGALKRGKLFAYLIKKHNLDMKDNKK